MNKAALRALAAQDQVEANARDLGAAALQPVDVDGPPIECGCGECPKDATWVLTIDAGRPSVHRMAACDGHLDAMTTAAMVSSTGDTE